VIKDDLKKFFVVGRIFAIQPLLYPIYSNALIPQTAYAIQIGK
tara:strand:+ start:1176 stop:1304 length:129 start_codon:yes stop_codon:yes gene_type:complete